MADFSDFAETMTRGDTHPIEFQVQLNGINQDTTTWLRFWMTFKRNVTDDADADAVIQLTDAPSGGIVAVDAAVGHYRAEIPPSATTPLDNTKTKLFGDIQGEDGSNKVWTLAKGTLLILPESTRSSI